MFNCTFKGSEIPSTNYQPWPVVVTKDPQCLLKVVRFEKVMTWTWHLPVTKNKQHDADNIKATHGFKIFSLVVSNNFAKKCYRSCLLNNCQAQLLQKRKHILCNDSTKMSLYFIHLYPPSTPNPQPFQKKTKTCCFLPCCAHLQKILSCDHSQSSHATTQDIVRICFQVHGTTLTSGLEVPIF